MRRAIGIALVLGSTCASVYAWRCIEGVLAINPTGNPVQIRQRVIAEMMWSMGWLGLAVVLAIAFVITARGRWRLVAALPLVICAPVAYAVAVFWPFPFT